MYCVRNSWHCRLAMSCDLHMNSWHYCSSCNLTSLPSSLPTLLPYVCSQHHTWAQQLHTHCMLETLHMSTTTAHTCCMLAASYTSTLTTHTRARAHEIHTHTHTHIQTHEHTLGTGPPTCLLCPRQRTHRLRENHRSARFFRGVPISQQSFACASHHGDAGQRLFWHNWRYEVTSEVGFRMYVCMYAWCKSAWSCFWWFLIFLTC
jgi:hypothetical protein